jgi:hypothetical protein
MTFAHLRCRNVLELAGASVMHRMGDLVVGEMASELLFHLADDLVLLLRPFGEPLQHRLADSLNLKSMLGRNRAIAERVNTADQFVAIDFRAETNGVVHGPGLKGFPGLLGVVERRVEHRAVRMQLRVQCAGSGVGETRGHEIAGRAIRLPAQLANPCGGKGFEFTKGDFNGILVGRDQTLVVQRHGQHGNRLGSRAGEIVEDAPVVLFVLAQGQTFTRLRMLVFTERLEWFEANLLPCCQSQPFRPKTNPLAGMNLLCRVIIVPGQMLLEVAFGVGEILLGDNGEHASVWGWISSHSCGESGGS